MQLEITELYVTAYNNGYAVYATHQPYSHHAATHTRVSPQFTTRDTAHTHMDMLSSKSIATIHSLIDIHLESAPTQLTITSHRSNRR